MKTIRPKRYFKNSNILTLPNSINIFQFFKKHNLIHYVSHSIQGESYYTLIQVINKFIQLEISERINGTYPDDERMTILLDHFWFLIHVDINAVSELSNILENNTSYLVDQMRDINLISAIIIARDTNPEFTTIEYIEKI